MLQYSLPSSQTVSRREEEKKQPNSIGTCWTETSRPVSSPRLWLLPLLSQYSRISFTKEKKIGEEFFLLFLFIFFPPPQLMSLGIYFSRISALYAQVGKRRKKKKKEEGAYTRRQNNNGSHLWQGLIAVHGIHDNRISNSVWNKLKMSTSYPVRNWSRLTRTRTSLLGHSVYSSTS